MKNKENCNVAIVGALGLVGSEMIRILEEKEFPVNELRPLDLPEYEGKEIIYRDEKVKTLAAVEENFKGIDIALFSAGTSASLLLAPKAAKQNVVVIDNSSAWRMDKDCPLIVPEVNSYDISWHKGIIANPNCSTIQMVAVLKPLHDMFDIERVVVSTYQAVSGGGRIAVEELKKQSLTFLLGEKITHTKASPHQIAFNVIPQIDVFEDAGYTKEENKMINETRKIMGAPYMKITATCVRVPIFYGHAEAINIQTKKDINIHKTLEVLNKCEGIKIIDDPKTSDYPMPITSEKNDKVMVGRIRRDFTVKNGLNLWVVANNIRKGAALNAVQIAELLIKNG